MNRLWIGAVLLVAVLVLGIGLSLLLPNLHEPVARRLEQAAVLAQQENWPAAWEMAKSARDRWEKLRYFAASVTDHQPLEEMERLFFQLTAWKAQEESGEFAASCLHLAQLARDTGRSQSLTWWNFL